MKNNQIIDLDSVSVDPSCVLSVPAEFAMQNRLLPLCVLNGDLMVAMADPRDVHAIADLRRACGVPVVALEADTTALLKLINKIYGGLGAIQESAQVNDAVSIVDYLLRMAFMRHASDIHFDPDAEGMRVRFRIDGELVEVLRVSPERQPSVTSRLKVMASLKLDERRAPQDGAFTWDVPEAFSSVARSVDVRLATLPGHYGEKITLRLLESGAQHQSLDSLGMSEEDYDAFARALRCPHGLILLTGPTGSGKTTTLYACIQKLLTGCPLNIITVENPIEYQIPSIFQAEVDAADKVNFSAALRSILRHDPDVIMIGEIRDSESLDTAVKAALTGHLVLSTLHTNDSVNAVTRLSNMGLERHLISATLRLSVAQRLVRSLCEQCRKPYEVTAETAALLGNPALAGKTFYAPGGCVCCAGRGLRGRTGLFEIFQPDVDIASAIAEGADETILKTLHRERGGQTLLDDGIGKCLLGITTAEEVSRTAYWL